MSAPSVPIDTADPANATPTARGAGVGAVARHPCVWCQYELAGLPYVGKARTCPECGKPVTDEDLYRFRRVPPLRPALIWICGPAYAASALVWIADAMRTTVSTAVARDLLLVRGIMVGLIVLWALAAPPIVATRRSNRCGRSPMGTIDETILGWALTIGLPVMVLFVRLLIKVTLNV